MRRVGVIFAKQASDLQEKLVLVHAAELTGNRALKPEVEVNQNALATVPGAETIPPFSVSIYELAVR